MSVKQKNIIKRSENGFSLMELLVAVVVMSIGLLGIAGMQTFGLRSVYNSNLLNVATSQATDLADRMRSNMTGVEDGGYDGIDGSETDPSCMPGCAGTNLAQYDAYIWTQANKALLHDNGTGSVTNSVTNNGDGTFTITISWKEFAGSEEEIAQTGSEMKNGSYSLRFQP